MIFLLIIYKASADYKTRWEANFKKPKWSRPMEISGVSTQYPAFDHRSFSTSISLAFATDLSLRTKEGDLVDISFQNERSLTESESQTRFSDGVAIREISSVAVAASRYSISVQGDLNEEELEAIQRLVEAIGPIARGFFARGEFNFESATEVLTGSLGVIKEIELELERVITATFSSQAFSSGSPIKAIDPGNVGSSGPSLEPIDTDKIRNLSDLIFSAVEAVFESQAAQLPKGESILRSLNDLVLFLQEQLGEFLNLLKNSTKPALEPLPQEIDVDFFLQKEPQA